MPDTAETLWGATEEFVTFSAGEQVFCIQITRIREIRRWAPVTALPHTPPDILGVMNLRGSVIPIMDLGARLGLGQTAANERNVVIIVIHEETSVGLLVQSVSEILSVRPEDFQDTSDMRSSSVGNAVTGIVSHNDTMIRMIDLDRVLSEGT